MIKMVHYLYVLSSWSLVAEEAVGKARLHFGDDLEYDWRIAVTDYSGEGPFKREQLQFFYDRLQEATGRHINLGWWYEGYDWLVPDRVVAAARILGATGNDVRLALALAGLANGQRITEPSVAIEIAAAAGSLKATDLRKMFADPHTTILLYEWSREFEASGVTLRPAFQLTNDLGDRVVLSGIWNEGPLISSIDALLTDEKSYLAFAASRQVATCQ